MRASILGALLLIPLGVASPVAAQTNAGSGVVEGTVTLDLPAPKRVAQRYPGAGPKTAQMHRVPVVIYLVGDLPALSDGGERAVIGQQEGRFDPGALAVSVGTRVSFPNEDPFYHNVFSYSGPRFDLGRYPVGETRSVVLDQPGIVHVFCEVHEFMRAVVVVTEHGHHAVVDDSGAFRLSGVPAGEYRLRAYHPDTGEVDVPVQVRAGETTVVTTRLAS